MVSSVVAAVSLGCSGPSLSYEIRGHIEADDDAGANQPCSLDLYLDGRPERLARFPVGTGADFGVAVHLPLFGPGEQWHGKVRCAGYVKAQTRTFELGSGWSTPPPVMLGVIKVVRMLAANPEPLRRRLIEEATQPTG